MDDAAGICRVDKAIAATIAAQQAILADSDLKQLVLEVSRQMCVTFKAGGKVLFCGNGGSAADAQHLAAELSGRFYFDRDPLFAEALHVNSSYLTAVANDYGYERVFSRLVKAMGRPGDLLVAISTSGNSPNLLAALQEARHLGLTTVAMTGACGGQMKGQCDYLLNMPTSDTPRIQESHILVGHIICQMVEEAIFGGARK